MAAKKKAVRGAQRPSKAPSGSIAGSIKLGKGELRIAYSDSHDLMDKLLRTTQSLSRLHSHMLLAHASVAGGIGAALDRLEVPDLLGPTRAFNIVSKCARGEQDFDKTLGDLGLVPAIFMSCVQDGVTAAGYKPEDFPATSGTKLSDVAGTISAFSK